MCKATLITYRMEVDKTNSDAIRQVETLPKFELYAKNANSLEYLVNKIYRHRQPILISNIRLFALLFLCDWSSTVHLGIPVTSGRWCLGVGAPYPVDYYEYLSNEGLLNRDDYNEIWRAKRHIIFNISFTGKEHSISDKQVAVIESVVQVAQKIGLEFNVDFHTMKYVSHCDGYVSNKEIENGKVKDIDERFLDIIYSLDPLLNAETPIDAELELVECAKRHSQAFKM